MGARVARVGDERADRAHHDLVGQVHRCASGRCEIECETTLLHQPSRPGQALLQIGNHGFHDRSADRLWELIVVPFAELSAPVLDGRKLRRGGDRANLRPEMGNLRPWPIQAISTV